MVAAAFFVGRPYPWLLHPACSNCFDRTLKIKIRAERITGGKVYQSSWLKLANEAAWQAARSSPGFMGTPKPQLFRSRKRPNVLNILLCRAGRFGSRRSLSIWRLSARNGHEGPNARGNKDFDLPIRRISCWPLRLEEFVHDNWEGETAGRSRRGDHGMAPPLTSQRYLRVAAKRRVNDAVAPQPHDGRRRLTNRFAKRASRWLAHGAALLNCAGVTS